jgi:hypothetical protein
MSKRRLTLVSAFVVWTFCGAPARAQSGVEKFLGTWAGTWDGMGAGEFELTLDKAKDGAPVGRVAVTTEGGNYTADLKNVAFDGSKMTAKYDFPLDTSAEVVIAATFDNRSAKGTWSLRPKGQDGEVAGGSWAVNKK